jgi:hypothetical protein
MTSACTPANASLTDDDDAVRVYIHVRVPGRMLRLVFVRDMSLLLIVDQYHVLDVHGQTCMHVIRAEVLHRSPGHKWGLARCAGQLVMSSNILRALLPAQETSTQMTHTA